MSISRERRAQIPFNRPYMTGQELSFISRAHSEGVLAGDGRYTDLCQDWLERNTTSHRVMLTHSCTAALEMAAILLDCGPGDEVIMPSHTFASTANAFVLRGAMPVFVDVREDTLNIDERLIPSAIGPRTKAIVAVHYAGVACEMGEIMAIGEQRGIRIVEDAAQAFMSNYAGQPLGAVGHLGTYSFHETKNVTSGQGGALLLNAPELVERAEIIREKGTDRSRFFRGEVDKYTWQDMGSSFLAGELAAAFLWAQLAEAADITEKRLAIWRRYRELLSPLEAQGLVRLPIVPPECTHNAHMFYVLLSPATDRAKVLRLMGEEGINAISHYVPLHSSPAGRRFGRTSGDLAVTDSITSRLIRLPLWIGLGGPDQEFIAERLASVLTRLA